MPRLVTPTEFMKAACALLSAGESRGTGFLVSPDRLLTCHHVIKNVGEGPILATFPHGQYEATVELADSMHDSALLRLTRPVPSRAALPLSLAGDTPPKGAAWEGYGFPAATGQAGLLIAGRVQDPIGQDPALRQAVVLHSANVTAGSWLNGFSGSPVLVNGSVIGQLRQIIPDSSGGAQLAVIYACPAALLAELARRRLRTAPSYATAFQLNGPAAGTQRRIFHVPPNLSPNFTGREKWLTALQQQLDSKRVVALWGLGGLGKTQTAVAFAHRYRDDYAAVLWLPGDSPSSFEQGLLELARPLAQAGHLPEALLDEQEPSAVRQVVIQYLRQANDYLLICDNADAPASLKTAWPRMLGGQVLFTSRSRDIRRLGAAVLELDKLSEEESRQLLGSCYPAQGPEEAQALTALAQELDGLPLALAQAGAYLTRHRCRYSAYLQGYQQKKLQLLEKGLPDDDYPQSVASTWALSIEQIEPASSASVELLKLCALLQPSAIPEELFADPAPELGARLQEVLLLQRHDAQALDDVLAPLLCYGLLQREPDNRTLSLHRLVQQALLHGMPPPEQVRWVRAAVAQLAAVFPSNLFTSWSKIRRLLPHALKVCDHCAHYSVKNAAVAYLLNEAGYFLSAQGLLDEAEQLVRRSLAIREEVLGAEHPDVATSLNTLAELLYAKPPLQEHPSDAQAQYREAELLVRRSLTIREEAMGAEHQAVASSLNNLAALLQRQGKLLEVEPFLRRALSVLEKSLGGEHPDVARGLNNLGLFLHSQGRIEEAERLLRRSLAIWDQVLEREHPATAYALVNLGQLLEGQNRRPEAEPLYRRALEIREKTLSPNHPLIERTRERLEQVLLAGPWRELPT